jgi:hypothetical protein
MDGSLDDEIAKAQARNRELAAYRDALRDKNKLQNQRSAYLSDLYEQQRRLEREIAGLEGRPYRSEEESEWEDPPEPPEPEI